MSPESSIAHYRITGKLGEGGMGAVYRATDTKLNREVAIKVLPPAFAEDAARMQRFEREAQVLASLNHPNIAAIYGIEAGAIVMELVEGEDLKGPVPVESAIAYARQIAAALEAAHEKGIIHRDLKPANIKVTPDDTVKLLDFGLAKASEQSAAPSAVSPTMSPTLSLAMTQAGMILGTAAYMSPEQARGKPVDKRTDIWAFGVVLFEMLTGRRPFQGDGISETLASVLKDTPSMDALPPTTPPRLARLIERCLDRDLKTRLRDIGEARIAIAGIEAGAPDREVTTVPAPPLTRRSALSRALPWAVAGVLGVVALWLWAPWRTVPAPPETRTEIVTPATDQPASFALSPDGQRIVFTASTDGASRLWLRPLATTTAQPLPGTEGASAPFWAPDGRAIGFFAGNALKRLDLGGGAPRTLAPAVAGRGGTWNADGVIVFAPSLNNPLMRVSATGGTAVAVTTLGQRQRGHHAPYFLPDGRRFLFYVQDAPDMAGIYLGALDGRASTRLTPADGSGAYLPAGWLLWVRAGALVAQRLDGTKAALTGETVTVAEGVPVDIALSASAVSVAATGLVAYRTGGGSQRQLTWVDRPGTPRGTIGDPDATLDAPRVSPDGRRVVVGRNVLGNADLWLLDGARARRFTFDPATDARAIWSPDGARIVFRSHRSGSGDLYQKLASGAGVEEPLLASDHTKTAYSWSADGRFLLYSVLDLKGDADLWVVPMAGDRTPSVFLKTPFREAYGAFSPDSRWVAYQSNESGRPEVYVRPFFPPGAAGTAAGAAGAQWQVSTAGGAFPAWRPDGKELYYLNPAGVMMAAPITVSGATLEPGAPVVLFPTRIVGGGVDGQQGRQYDVAPDGRFLINTELDSAAAPITLIQNWNPAVKK